MSIQETLLTALSTYGVIAIFGSVLVSSFGLPLPASFLLILAGSFIEQGELELLPVLIAGIVAAIIGDHLGYSAGWFGGRTLANRISKRLRAESLLARAENTSRKWGGVSVFFSRWLLTALGPYINLTSGISRYQLPRFSLWVVLGEAVWVIACVQLGRLFNDRVAELTDLLGEFTWVILGLVATVVLGYQVFKMLRKPKPS